MSKAYEIYNELYLKGNDNEALAAWQKLAAKGDVEAMSLLGSIYWEDLGHYAESIRWFEKAISAGDLDCRYWISFPLLELGRFEDAERALLSAVDANHSEAVIELANLYRNQLQAPDKAESFLLDQANSGLVRAKVLLVDLYLEQNKSQLASEFLSEIQSSRSAPDLSALVRVLREHKEIDLVITAVRAAADAGDIESQRELVSALEQIGDDKELANFLGQVISQSKKPALYSLACALDQGELARKTVYSPTAEKLFTHLAGSGNRNSYLRLANLILRDRSRNRQSEALPWFVKAAEGGSRPAQVRLCLLASRLGEIDLFNTWFAVALDKGLPGQNRQFGLELRKIGMAEAALRAFAHEFENGRKHWAPEYSVALWQAGHLKEAQEVIEYVSTTEQFQLSSVGFEFMIAKNFEKATEFLLKDDPENSVKLSYSLAYSYWRLGNVQDSKRFLNMAEKNGNLEEETANFLYLGRMNYRLGALEKARDQVRKVTEASKQPDNDVRLRDQSLGFELLGAAYFALEDKILAANCWVEANLLNNKACSRYLAVEGREISSASLDLYILQELVESRHVLSLPA